MKFIRPLLALSLAANVVAAGVAFSSWRGEHRLPAPTAAEVSQPAEHVRDKATPDPPPATPPKFHWRQLESEDYSTFIANLRSVGCPDSTVRDIVQGELNASVVERRNDLERRILRNPAVSPPPGMTRYSYLDAQLRKLDQEVSSMTANLIKNTPAPATIATINGDVPSSIHPALSAPATRMPLVFGNFTLKPVPTTTPTPTSDTHVPPRGPVAIAPGVVQATPEQIAGIQRAQEHFTAELGGTQQDTTDPQYAQRWRHAQPTADQLYRTWYGWAAANELGKAAAQQAYAEKQGEAQSPP